MRTYSELSEIGDYYERFRYLQCFSEVGGRTFGGERWLNQRFYRSREWNDVRQEVVLRDQARDMGHPDYPIGGKIIVHHMNPIDPAMLKNRSELVWDPEYLISVSMMTHNAVHYGDENLLPREPIVREKGDTIPWLRAS